MTPEAATVNLGYFNKTSFNMRTQRKMNWEESKQCSGMQDNTKQSNVLSELQNDGKGWIGEYMEGIYDLNLCKFEGRESSQMQKFSYSKWDKY